MAGRMSSSRTKPHDVHRGRGPGAGASVAQLAGPVEAPAPNRSTYDATADHRAGVRPAGGDRDHARARTEPDNVNRDVGAGESPVAQPTGPVVAPALDLSLIH